MRVLVTAALAIMISNQALAHDYQAGDIKVMHPYSVETAAMAQAGAGYMELVNTGDVADTLLAVEADFPRVMLHESVMDGDVARMEHLMQVEVPAGETVSFAPGGKHVMFMGLGGDPFEVGETFDATLIFENAGRIDVVFKVEEAKDVDAHAGH